MPLEGVPLTQLLEPLSLEWEEGGEVWVSDPILNLLSANYDVGGDGDAVKIFPVPPRTLSLLLPSHHNP